VAVIITDNIIPADWLPDPKLFPMKRIVTHWTVGRHEPNDTDLKAYHFLISGKGAPVRGKHPVSENSSITPAAAKIGAYAAHVASFNEGSIGLSMCGCFVAKVVPIPGIGSEFPLTAAQWISAVAMCRQLVKHFSIPQTEKRGTRTGPTVIGHCEVDQVWAIPQKGKIDPWYPMVGWPWSMGKTPMQIGNEFRRQVWAK
jgi:hypothetical protein